MTISADGAGSLPIVGKYQVRITGPERARIRDLANDLRARNRDFPERRYFEPHAKRGLADGPLVVIGDSSEIPLLSHRVADPFEYRLSTLARAGDMVVLGGRGNPDFETYLEHGLGLGRRHYLRQGGLYHANMASAPARCLSEPSIYNELRAKIEELGGATLLPHIATGTVWSLARKLGQDTSRPVHVAGPLPALSRLANNKLWFAEVAGRLFGKTATPPQFPVHGLAALAARAQSLARNATKLVIKIPDSAGSAGNIPVSASTVAQISSRGLKHLHRHLSDLVAETGARSGSPLPDYPLMVQVWENNVLTSPSAQVWIPLAGDGPPIVEGIFEQRVTGPEGHFSGATQADLPDRWTENLAHDALMLGLVFQRLGYFGRCSFDTVLSGDSFDAARLSWIECNARWGGVSVPMTLLNRLFPGSGPPPHLILHLSRPQLSVRSFADGMELLKDMLWLPGRNSGVIFMTPSGFEEGAGLHFISLAVSLDEAEAQAAEVLERLRRGG